MTARRSFFTVAGSFAIGISVATDSAPSSNSDKAQISSTLPRRVWVRGPAKYVSCVALDVMPYALSRFPAVIGQLENIGRTIAPRVNISLGLGSSLFSETPALRPRQLKPMPGFSGDLLDESQTHGDALVYLEGDSAVDLEDAARRLLSLMPHVEATLEDRRFQKREPEPGW